MKTILCYGDSNLRGFVPGSFDEKTGLSARHPKHKRWTGIVQDKLGAEYHIIEEGLNGRTTSLDEITPGRPFRNGLTHLPLSLESHFPIDLVIFMLGSNDCKAQFQKTAQDIAAGMRKLIHAVKTSDKGPGGKAPHSLIIASPPMLPCVTQMFGFDARSVVLSQTFPALYKQLAQEEKCGFLDASAYIKSCEIDGVHFTEDQMHSLGEAVAKKITQLFYNS